MYFMYFYMCNMSPTLFNINVCCMDINPQPLVWLWCLLMNWFPVLHRSLDTQPVQSNMGSNRLPLLHLQSCWLILVWRQHYSPVQFLSHTFTQTFICGFYFTFNTSHVVHIFCWTFYIWKTTLLNIALWEITHFPAMPTQMLAWLGMSWEGKKGFLCHQKKILIRIPSRTWLKIQNTVI